MNLSKTNFCQTEEGWLRSDSVVAAFATTAADGIEQQSCASGALRARAQNHFVGLHEMVCKQPPKGIQAGSLKDHSEELLGMVPSEQAAVRAEIRDYLEGLGL